MTFLRMAALVLLLCISFACAGRSNNAYDVLGVSKDASQDDIRRQYRKLCLQYHPDKNVSMSPKARERCEERFKQVQQANEEIGDEASRRRYDLQQSNPFSSQRSAAAGMDQRSYEDFFRSYMSSSPPRPRTTMPFYVNGIDISDLFSGRSAAPWTPRQFKSIYIQKVSVPLQDLYAGKPDVDLELKDSLWQRYRAACRGGVAVAIDRGASLSFPFQKTKENASEASRYVPTGMHGRGSLHLFLLFTTAATTFSQLVCPYGTVEPRDYTSDYVSISADGRVVALGASEWRGVACGDYDKLNIGLVNTFEDMGNGEWFRRGSFTGTGDLMYRLGPSALSDDGNVLATRGVTSVNNRDGFSVVYVYDYFLGNWQPRNNTGLGNIYMKDIEYRRWLPHLSGDGNSLVRVYGGEARLDHWNGRSWRSESFEFNQNGDCTPSQAGGTDYASGINRDATVMAVTCDDFVMIYTKIDEGKWEKLGQDITLPYVREISLSSDGGTVAIATDEHVQVYRLVQTSSESFDWYQMGQTISGYFHSSLSGDGLRLAIASSPESKGLLRIYQFNDPISRWEQVGVDVRSTSYDQIGEDVALSRDGSTAVLGSDVQWSICTDGKKSESIVFHVEDQCRSASSQTTFVGAGFGVAATVLLIWETFL